MDWIDGITAGSDSHFLCIPGDALWDGEEPSLGTVHLEIVALTVLGTLAHHFIVQAWGRHKDEDCGQEHQWNPLTVPQHPIRLPESGQSPTLGPPSKGSHQGIPKWRRRPRRRSHFYRLIFWDVFTNPRSASFPWVLFPNFHGTNCAGRGLSQKESRPRVHCLGEK